MAMTPRSWPRLCRDCRATRDQFSPITLDLNGKALVRARAEDQERGTQAVLSRSQVTGKAICYPVNRHFFARAMALGFTDVHFINADTPALCQEDQRKYVFLGLGKQAALSPTDNELCLSSDAENTSIPQQPLERSKSTVRTTTPQPAPAPIPSNGNGQDTHDEQPSENGHHKPGTFAALLEEGQAVQNTLRDALLRTNQLLNGLKHYRRQAKAMNSTLASLRQLQEVEA